MKFKPKSLTFKFFTALITLTLINSLFFAIVIYEGRAEDIIIKNSLIAEKTAFKLGKNINNRIKKFSEIVTDSKIITEEIILLMKNSGYKYSLYDKNGKKLFISEGMKEQPATDITLAIKETAVENSAFTLPKTQMSKDYNTVSVLIPVFIMNGNNLYIYLLFDVSTISSGLAMLNSLIIATILFLLVTHSLFVFALYRFFIMPLNRLKSHSILTAENLDNNADEFSLIIDSINNLVRETEEKDNALKKITDTVNSEIEIMTDINKIIFPKLPDDPRFNYSIFHRAALKISADYYDTFNLADSKKGFAMVNVSANGMIAAELKIMAKNFFHKYVAAYHDPGQLLKYINSEATLLLRKHEQHSALFMTSFYLTIDKNNVISYCSAGLKAILIINRIKKIRLLDTGGFVLGISKDMNNMFKTSSEKLDPGDRIILYSDGFIETKDPQGEEYGIQRFLGSIKKNYMLSVDELMVNVMDDLYRHIHFTDPPRDITLFIIEIKERAKSLN